MFFLVRLIVLIFIFLVCVKFFNRFLELLFVERLMRILFLLFLVINWCLKIFLKLRLLLIVVIILILVVKLIVFNVGCFMVIGWRNFIVICFVLVLEFLFFIIKRWLLFRYIFVIVWVIWIIVRLFLLI